MRKFALIASIVLVAANLLWATDLETHRATYERNLESLVLSHGMAITELDEHYTKALDVLLARVRKAGDLEKTMAVMQESKRFSEEKTISEESPDFRELQKLQSSYTKRVSVLEKKNRKKRASLVLAYDSALEALQKKLVVANRLDEAMAVQQERKSVSASSGVTRGTVEEKSGEGDPRVAALPRKTNAEKMPSPVLWLKCDAVKDRVVEDSSGFGNHAFLHAVAETDFVRVGRGNRAIRLKRGFLKIRSSDSLLLGRKDYTLSIWCKPDKTAELTQGLITKFEGGDDKEFGFMIDPDGFVSAHVEKGGRAQHVDSHDRLKPNQWYHLVVTSNASAVERAEKGAVKIYVNGKQVKTVGSITTRPDDTDSDIQIGHFYSPAYTRYFEGLIDDARIYSAELNARQVAALWESPPAPEMTR